MFNVDTFGRVLFGDEYSCEGAKVWFLRQVVDMIVSNFEAIGCRSMSKILLFINFVMIGCYLLSNSDTRFEGDIFIFFFFGVYRDCAKQTLALGDWGCAGYFLIYWDFVLPYFEFVIWMWSLPLVNQGLHPLSAQPGLHPRHLVYWISYPGRGVTEARIHDREPDPGLSSSWWNVRTFWWPSFCGFAFCTVDLEIVGGDSPADCALLWMYFVTFSFVISSGRLPR